MPVVALTKMMGLAVRIRHGDIYDIHTVTTPTPTHTKTILTLHQRLVRRNVGILGGIDQHAQALVGQQGAQDDHAAAGDEAGLPQSEGHPDDAAPHDARDEVGHRPADAALGLVGRRPDFVLLERLGAAGTLDLDEAPGGSGGFEERGARTLGPGWDGHPKIRARGLSNV